MRENSTSSRCVPQAAPKRDRIDLTREHTDLQMSHPVQDGANAASYPDENDVFIDFAHVAFQSQEPAVEQQASYTSVDFESIARTAKRTKPNQGESANPRDADIACLADEHQEHASPGQQLAASAKNQSRNPKLASGYWVRKNGERVWCAVGDVNLNESPRSSEHEAPTVKKCKRTAHRQKLAPVVQSESGFWARQDGKRVWRELEDSASACPQDSTLVPAEIQCEGSAEGNEKEEKGHSRSSAGSKVLQGELLALWDFVHDDDPAWNKDGNKLVGKEAKRDRTEGRKEGYISAWQAVPDGVAHYRVLYLDGTWEDISGVEALAATTAKGLGHTRVTYGFSFEFAIREAHKKKVQARAAPPGEQGSQVETSLITDKAKGSGASYTTSVTTYDVEWDKLAGAFEHRKIMGKREVNGQTGLSGEYTDEFFPVMSTIFNHVPLTKVELRFKDAHTDQDVVLTAIAYNRRQWMRAGAVGSFHHGGLMLSGDWGRWRRQHSLTIGDTVIIRRGEDQVLRLDFQRGADEALLGNLHANHYAVRAQTAGTDLRPQSEKRVSMPPQLWAQMMERPFRQAPRRGKPSAGAKADKEELTLEQLLRHFQDKRFLADWQPARPVTDLQGAAESGGECVEWEPNVRSEVTERQCNFRYISRSELFRDESEFCNSQLYARIACLLQGSLHTFYPGLPCPKCGETGKVPVDTPSLAAAQTRPEPPNADGRGEEGTPQTGGEGGGKGLIDPAGSEGQEEKGGEEGKGRAEACGKQKQRRLERNCRHCKGSGTVCGDSPLKQQLMGGVPYKLLVTAQQGRMGSGVVAEEFIPAGHAVCEYAGELVKAREATMREKVYQRAGLFYLYNLNPDYDCEHYWALDATRAGNVARFINHKCAGFNLKCRRVAASCSYSREAGVPGRIVLVAVRDIEAGEMLSYDYDTFNVGEGELGIEMHRLVRCHCGEPECAHWVF